MGYRLSKIYTKTGDKGQTSLSAQNTVSKDSAIIDVIGEVDHLNTSIGLVISFSTHQSINDQLNHIQHQLFNIGAELAYPQHCQINEHHITQLETLIDQHNDRLSPLKEFILPGGSHAASFCHQARTNARTTERRYVTLHNAQEHNNPLILKYLNRLSDYLFVAARRLNQLDKHAEILWQSHRVKEIKNNGKERL